MTARLMPRLRSAPEGDAALHVELRGVSKAYASGSTSVLALDRVDLSVTSGEFVALVGASGCGKSTLLNLVAGLDQPSSGDVRVAGRATLMFQEPALYPWLSARANVELPLRFDKVGKAARRTQAGELLDLVQLGEFAERRPHELSGGMRQRVALARVFAQQADVIGMDEPFGALDAMTRDLLHDELERLWTRRRFTTLFVTHNVREAVRLADRVVLLSSRPGRVVAEYAIDIPRPRRMDSPEVASAAAEITDALRREVARHAG